MRHLISAFAVTVTILSACQAPQRPSEPTSLLEPAAFDGRHLNSDRDPNYLAMKLPYPPFEALRMKLEAKLGRKLNHRGEAHITVLTPPEFATLSRYLTIHEIHEIALRLRLQNARVSEICLGEGAIKTPAMQTYFVVVQAPELIAIRRAIRDAVIERGGDRSLLNAEHFYPHITVGFTDRDLHEGDGVTKSPQTCQLAHNGADMRVTRK